MAAPVDLELKKAFTELQAKVIDTQQKVKLADIQIEQLNRTKKHAHLTDTEIMTLIDETNMYEGVGRMFILQSKEVIHNQLLEKQKIAEEKIKELEVSFESILTVVNYKKKNNYLNFVMLNENVCLPLFSFFRIVLEQ
ncbi:prefoldin subunit 1 isoform X1 [Panthera uncia]|uniref:prefoldin subunit 1 isoform X1 n=1 Tax=Panthera uncia TaxID=29064 RepID=UPI0020FFE732|nr:prefoldin subunit 1 isoform X1 [Panthera uncia]